MKISIKEQLQMLSRLPEDVRTVVQTLLLSLAAALGAVLFMAIMNGLFSILYIQAAKQPPLIFTIQSFVFMMGSSFIVALLLKKVPEAAGSGIPQVKAAYWKELGYIPFKTVIIKFIAGIVSIGGGASLGREGPTIFLGSGVASFLSGLTGTPKRQRRAATAIGASAGLAAAFNTPLAAITFSIEELINDLNTRFLGRVVLASLFGALVVYALIGKQPAFALPQVVVNSWTAYIFIPLVALIASLLGVVFQKGSLKLRDRNRQNFLGIPRWLNPCIGGFITWVIGISVYFATGKIGIFGLGYHELSESLLHGSIWWIAGILVIGKLIATIVSYSFGGCGGIFSPMLFIGGMSGAFVAGVASLLFPRASIDHVVLSTVGMSACLGAVIRAPLTSTLIVFEMTHQFEVVPGLMISAFVSQIITRMLGLKHNFYDALLLQDGHELIKIKPPQDLKSWQGLPVSHIMNVKPVIIESIDPTDLHTILDQSPFQCYPYVHGDGKISVLTRENVERALAAGKEPVFTNARTVRVHEPVKEAAQEFINSPNGFLVVLQSETDDIAGILTLHDLLRAQASVAE